MTQINTPYPATAYLTGFLRERGIDAVQADPAIALVLKLFSRSGLEAMGQRLASRFGENSAPPPSVKSFQHQLPQYLRTVEPAIRFLQGRDPMLAYRICHENFLPTGPRFQALSQLDAQFGEAEGNGLAWAFGFLGLQDRAQHLASLYIDDIADAIREGIDERFELSRYAEKLALAASSFEPLQRSLQAAPTLVDHYLDEITRELIKTHQPTVVGLTVPFPGNVYGAFRIARVIKSEWPEIKIVLGGGYVNTELRDLRDPRVFDYIDYLTLDDGERPLLCILEQLSGQRKPEQLLRTQRREQGNLVWINDPTVHDIPFRDCGTPTYDGLPLNHYLSLCELLNPMHRLWSDGRWNKLTLAHGCYWKKCSFCDVSLDYIGRYEDLDAARIVDRMEKLIAETGQSGFHFVDEAAPPKTLAALAKEILKRGLTVTWWGNIRFEKTFSPELTSLLAASGCIAVSGGLEVASDRLLKLMEKGVTVEQVARVTHAFTQAGIMVHAYLMFGFPTQTLAETIDSLERVRQLFEAGCLQSAFWHRFACTIHSPVGRHPERYGITLLPLESTFAQNDIGFEDPSGVDHDSLHPGLKKALYNYMHGMGLEEDVRTWFDFPVPKAKVPRGLVRKALSLPSAKAGKFR